jgi:hypothetical protein
MPVASVTATASPMSATTGSAQTRVETSAPALNLGVVPWVALLTIGSFVIVTAFGALLQGMPQSWATMMFLFSLVAPALVATFGIFLVRGDWRDGITAGFVVAYLLMLLSAVGLGFGDRGLGTTESLRNVLVQNFTSLMSIVIVFYFGSEGAIQVANQIAAARLGQATANAAAQQPDGMNPS